MRFVVVGLGGIGGTLAARLHLAGHAVLGLARGPHLSAVGEHGLRLETPTGSFTASLEVVARPAEVEFTEHDVVVLAVKSQDTADVVHALSSTAPESIPVLCAQNGVVNEPLALRFFRNVYGVVVMCPTTYLQPGTVQAHSTPITGLLDVGRHPEGEDEVSRAVAAALNGATYDSRSIPDVRRWKYAKLLTNLGNAVEAACGPAARSGPLTDLLQAEGEAVLRVAGIDHASAAEDRIRRGSLLDLQPVGGKRRPGGSAWQSLARGTGVSEVDYLCGEIVLLGRLHGVPTPVNSCMQRLVARLARTESAPGALTSEEVMAQIGAGGRSVREG